MAILNRITRLFRADMHEMLDRLEQPDVLLRDAIRTMEAAQAQSAAIIKQQAAELSNLLQQSASFEADIQKLNEELELCLQLQNLALARTILRKKLAGEKQWGRCNQLIETRNKSLEVAKSEYAEKQNRLDTLKQHANLTSLEQKTDPESCINGTYCVSDEEVEIALLREQQKRGASC